MGRRLALLVATYEYQDTGLRQLTAPAHDAEALAAVLADDEIAGFQVTTLINEPHYRVGEAISELYRDRRRDDLTVLYFTCHGLKDDDGRLYLATVNSRRESLLFTSLPAEQIDQAMSACASHQRVLILDCCYGGAFPANSAKGVTEVHSLDRFRGRGRAVLTASDATQYAFEGDQAHGQPVQSVFTRYLVQGLRDGSADLDGDGDITIDELYTYVHDRVIDETPHQRPKRQDNVEGRIVIARNVKWMLPQYLRHALDSPISAEHLTALDGLTRLFRIGNEQVRAQALAAIRQLTADDSRAVSAAAAEQLRMLMPEPARPEPQRPGPAHPEPPRARHPETGLPEVEDNVSPMESANPALNPRTDGVSLFNVAPGATAGSTSPFRDNESHSDAEAAYREAIRLDPADAWAHNGLGNALHDLKRYADAEAAYREAIRLHPANAIMHRNLGNTLHELKRYADAEAAAQEALRLDPKDAQAHATLGDALHDLERYADAEAAYREAIRLNPANAIMHRNLGNTLNRLERYADAEAAAQEALRLDPKYAQAHATLGDALHDLERYADAEAAYREAIRLNPADGWAHSGLGDALHELERHADAEAAYREAIRLDPADGWAHSGLGDALHELERHADAEAAYREAIRLNPADAWAHNGLGNALHDLKRYADAEAAYREAIRLNPANAIMHRNLGNTLHELKR